MKARRGDLILIEERRDYGTRTSTYVIEKVTSVASDGQPRETSDVTYGPRPLFRCVTQSGHKQRRYRCYYQTHYLIPAADVDTEAAWEDWADRALPRDFPSIDMARIFIQPFRKVQS